MRTTSFKNVRIASVALATLAIPGGAALAHGTHHVVLESAHSIAIEFLYTGPSPMLFASVQVFAPGQDQPYQTGRTDRAGRFAFVPSEPGTWRIEVDDNDGHRHKMTVDVPEDKATTPRPVRKRSSSGP
jgi:nickel transport protein